MPSENIAPQDDMEVIIIIKSTAKAPIVTSRAACFCAASCNFFATVVVKLADFTAASFVFFAACPARLAFAYSRLMRCFCSLFCSCFYNVFSCISGISSKNFR